MTDFIFTADWIAPVAYDGKVNYYFMVRKAFDLSVARAVIRLSADSNYVLNVNGRTIGRGPVRGSCALQYFDTIELDDFIRTGKNELEIWVYTAGEGNFISDSVAAAVIAEIPGVLRTDASWDVYELPQWRREVPYFTSQTGFMECRDLRCLWSRQVPAQTVKSQRLLTKQLTARDVTELSSALILPRTLEFVYSCASTGDDNLADLTVRLNTEELAPIESGRIAGVANLGLPTGETVIRSNGRGVRMVLDFGVEFTGYLGIELDAPAGCIMDVTYGEMIVDGTLRARYSHESYNFTDRYYLRAGSQVVGNTFVERGGRRIQLVLRNFDRDITIRTVKVCDRRYAYSQRGDFVCSDDRINRVYQMCLNTLSACTTDIFVDCPWREHAFWVNDLAVENAATLAAFGPLDLHRRAFRLAFSQAQPDGLLPGVCPVPTGKFRHQFIFPATNLLLLQMLEDYWLFSGDDAVIREHWAALQTMLQTLLDRAGADGVIRPDAGEWNFFDWSFELNGYNFNNCRESMTQSLLAGALQILSRLAAVLGLPVAPEITRKAQKTVSAWRHFIDPTTGKLTDEINLKGQKTMISSQLAHAFALLYLPLADSETRAFYAALTDESMLIPEYFYHFFWFRAIAAGDNRLVACGLDRIRRYWGRCIDAGSGTLYETGIHSFALANIDQVGSLCHGFATAPADFFMRKILGVTPLSPGFREFCFIPALGDLSFARGRVPTPAGEIAVTLQRDGQAIRVQIRIPDGLTAVLADGTRLTAGAHDMVIR